MIAVVCNSRVSGIFSSDFASLDHMSALAQRHEGPLRRMHVTTDQYAWWGGGGELVIDLEVEDGKAAVVLVKEKNR